MEGSSCLSPRALPVESVMCSSQLCEVVDRDRICPCPALWNPSVQLGLKQTLGFPFPSAKKVYPAEAGIISLPTRGSKIKNTHEW